MIRLYKHVNNSTVAVQVFKRFYVKEKELYKMKVIWWNIGDCHKPFCMNITDSIEVSRKDWNDNWKIYNTWELDLDNLERQYES